MLLNHVSSLYISKSQIFLKKYYMNTSIFFCVSRSFFLLFKIVIPFLVILLWFFFWGIFYGTWNIFWWLILMFGNIFLIIWFFSALIFFSLRIFFDENSVTFVNISNILYPQKKSLLFKDITKVTFEQKWFFPHVFWFGTLFLHIWEEKISFSCIKNGKEMTEKIVNHLKNHS